MDQPVRARSWRRLRLRLSPPTHSKTAPGHAGPPLLRCRSAALLLRCWSLRAHVLVWHLIAAASTARAHASPRLVLVSCATTMFMRPSALTTAVARAHVAFQRQHPVPSALRFQPAGRAALRAQPPSCARALTGQSGRTEHPDAPRKQLLTCTRRPADARQRCA
jgi:hypothetical protein